jgi:DNA-binding MarR family transcriptional regulator
MHDRLPNLLGATALGVVDLTGAAIDAAGGRNPSWSAALIIVARHPGIGATELARRIKLTQPAVSRLVDGLEARGLVERDAPSGRSVALRLTAEGEAAARRLLDARHEVLDSLLTPLDEAERATLEQSLEKILDRAYDWIRSEFVMCRLCDEGACIGGGAVCPVGQAGRERGERR